MKRIALLALLALLVIAGTRGDPPTPHNVNGFVFHNGSGTGVQNGVVVRINLTTTGTLTYTQVFAPPVLAGAYAATVNGTTGELITVHAWNATHFGNGSALLVSTTGVNVTLNRSRGPEPNITIITPASHAVEEADSVFNVSVNVTLLGAGGTCGVTIAFSNASVLSGAGTLFLPPLAPGQTGTLNFTVTGVGIGNSSITANASCGPYPVFEATTTDAVHNITVRDTRGPLVTIISPPDAWANRTSKDVSFRFNVTDFSPVANCTLFLDGVANQTFTGPQRNVTLVYNRTLENGPHLWNITCVDALNQTNGSATRTIVIDYWPPSVNVSAEASVVLNAGTTRLVACNLSVIDGNGSSDITSANATFHFHLNSSAGAGDPGWRYVNSSCSVTGSSGNERNFTCTYPVQYFAVNGTWNCTASVQDSLGLVANGTNQTAVDPLFALNVSDTLMSFGDVEAGYVSANITQNVSNLGNLPINVTVYGYGLSLGDGNAFGCANVNISVENVRFAPNSSADYAQKQSLSGSPTQVRILIPRQVVLGVPSRNTTYWQASIPKNVSDIGLCNGTIVFQAELS